MKAVSAAVARALDVRAVREKLVPSYQLMTAAGKALALHASEFASCGSFFAVLAGHGNNGGDGLVAARFLREQGFQVKVWLAAKPSDLKGDALRAWNDLPQDVPREFKLELQDLESAVVVDAMLGTGFSGQLRAPYRHWISIVNLLNHTVVSADIPSGLDPDTGNVEEQCVRADMTVAFGVVKQGMLFNRGPRQCGRIRVADIGIPEECLDDVSEFHPCVCVQDFRRYVRATPFDAHKYQKGHVLVVGGSKAYPSAPFLAAEAALRSGAGIVTVAIPENVEIFCSPPKALIVKRLPAPNGVFCKDSAKNLAALLDGKDAIVAGPGLDHKNETTAFLRLLMRSAQRPLLLDADALNLISMNPDLLNELGTPTIVTPHEGEMERLEKALGLAPCSDRIRRAVKCAQLTAMTVVLKGPRTVTASPSGEYWINLSGSPALATAGSGDVLSGIIAAFICAARHALPAAIAGVFCHGIAGEIAAPIGGAGVIADDLPGLLPEALRRIRLGRD